MTKTLIIGASMSGLRTAEALRRNFYEGEITLVGAETHMPYNRPPLSKDLLAKDQDMESILFPIKPDELLCNFILGDAAISTSLDIGEVTLTSGNVLNYDYLVAATGLRSKKLDFPNDLTNGRYRLRTYDESKALRSAVSPGKRVVILGAGFIGLELAATLVSLGCVVSIVAQEPIPLGPILGDQFGLEIQRRHESHGVSFYLSNAVKELIGKDEIQGVVLSDQTSIPCDIFIEAVGSEPNTSWLAGNELDLGNGVRTDGSLRATKLSGEIAYNVFAVGDVARFPYSAFDLPARRIEHWNIPMESSKRVAREICHQLKPGSIEGFDPEINFNPVPSFWSDQYEFSILSHGEARLSDEINLIEGDLYSEFIFEYLFRGSRVGVAGIGMKSKINKLRSGISL